MNKRVGIVRDKLFLRHVTGAGHVESAERLLAIDKLLETSPITPLLQECPVVQADRRTLCLVHTARYVEALAGFEGYADPDTVVSALSFEAARGAAGSVCSLVDHVVDGRLSSGFALVRPPGHHAEAGHTMGFCLFNNIAVAAAYARQKYGLDRIAIVDWDLHHGNGTQHLFDGDAGVLYLSTHQYPFYPGTGALTETGNGAGRGFTVNVPLPAGMGDAQYLYIFSNLLRPILLAYQPQLILVSAGFDAYHADPLGGMLVTAAGFASLTRVLLEVAEAVCGGKLVLGLEGGYHLEGLAQCVEAVLKELLFMDTGQTITSPDPGAGCLAVVETVRAEQKKYWPL